MRAASRGRECRTYAEQELAGQTGHTQHRVPGLGQGAQGYSALGLGVGPRMSGVRQAASHHPGAICSPGARSSLLLGFVNKALLGQGHIHSFYIVCGSSHASILELTSPDGERAQGS